MGGAGAVGYGLLTASGAGSADFLAKTTTDRVGPLASLWYLECFGAPILVGLALGLDGVPQLPLGPALALVALSVLSVLGLFFLYRAFEHGRLSVVAPLTSGYPALVTLLSTALLGERFSGGEFAGLVVTLGGIVVLAQAPRSSASDVRGGWGGVGSAIAAFFAFGLFYFGLKLVLGPIHPTTGAAITRLVGLAIVAPWALRGRLPLLPPAGLRARAITFPVLDSLALVVFNLGVVLAGSISILTTVSGLYGAVTLAWAVVVLRERPTARQWTGCGLVFVGVVLLAAL